MSGVNKSTYVTVNNEDTRPICVEQLQGRKKENKFSEVIEGASLACGRDTSVENANLAPSALAQHPVSICNHALDEEQQSSKSQLNPDAEIFKKDSTATPALYIEDRES